MEYRRLAAALDLRPLQRFACLHPDLLLCGSITLLAAVLRLWALGSIPAGIHGDEAQVGLDARRVLLEGWIGPYTWSALGQPAGHAYLTAPAIAIFGSNAWAVRLPLALTGIAAVPLAYVLFRMLSSRVPAGFGASLLAVSLWHLHLSRVAHWPISYPTVELAVLTLWLCATRTGSRPWFAATGAVLGLGLYTYNIYPVFVLGFSIWVAAYTLLYKRGANLKVWSRKVALAGGVSFVVGLPLFAFVATHTHDYFAHYDEYYDRYSVLRSYRFQHGTLLDKADVLKDQVVRFAGAYIWEGVPDRVDGAAPDRRPIIDPLTLALFALGLLTVVRRWRAPSSLLCLSLFAVLPLAGVLQTNATYRATLGLAPFVAFLAAAPLAILWSEAATLAGKLRPALRAVLCLAVVLIAAANLQTYFGSWAGSRLFDTVYGPDFTEAVQYVDALPNKPYIYLLSDSFSIDHETRLFLAPKLLGEDRSFEFRGERDLSFDRSRAGVAVLMDAYVQDNTLQTLQEMYRSGEAFTRYRGGRIAFIVYTLPPPIRLTPPSGAKP